MRPLDGPLTFPIIGNFPIKNVPLLDLLGTGFALQPRGLADKGDEWRLAGDGWRVAGEDNHPVGYDILTGGVRELPPYTVYENTQAFPRAFVVPEGRALPPAQEVMDTLVAADLRACVLLEAMGRSRAAGRAVMLRTGGGNPGLSAQSGYDPCGTGTGRLPGVDGYLVSRLEMHD